MSLHYPNLNLACGTEPQLYLYESVGPLVTFSLEGRVGGRARTQEVTIKASRGAISADRHSLPGDIAPVSSSSLHAPLPAQSLRTLYFLTTVILQRLGSKECFSCY
ncbi:hypothetical protein E2C01_063687 [Portunus trituberculatus]|uniref:Uncharacterized protein n=1 Tax=Portunus trituberculatus TaxID=210409 RepID=A0A5B7HEC0_PORTR|nr:hypothetical protein [Portunus trituberculatus]